MNALFNYLSSPRKNSADNDSSKPNSIKKLNTKPEPCSNLSSKNNYQSLLSEKIQENLNLKNEIISLKSEKELFEKELGNNSLEKEKLDNLKSENNKFRNSLNLKDKEISNIKLNNKNENDRLKSDNDRLKNENDRLKIENRNLNNDKDRVKNENDRLKIENRNFNNENDRVKNECKNLKFENSLLNNEKSNLQNNLNKSNNQNSFLNNSKKSFLLQLETIKSDLTKVEQNEGRLIEEIEEYKNVNAHFSSLLNEKDIKLLKLEDQLRNETKKTAEFVSLSGLENKNNESQLGKLPNATDVNNVEDGFINIMENYYMNSELEDLSDQELAPIIKDIFDTSFKFCLNSINNALILFFKSYKPNDNQIFNFKCLVHSIKDEYILESSGNTFKYLLQLLTDVHAENKNELENTKKFILECCKFIWTVFLSQPEVRFKTNNDESIIKPVEYSTTEHKSFGLVKGEQKMCVQLTVIPSIYLVRDGKSLTKSCVLLKPMVVNTPMIEETRESIRPTTSIDFVKSSTSNIIDKYNNNHCVGDDSPSMSNMDNHNFGQCVAVTESNYVNNTIPYFNQSETYPPNHHSYNNTPPLPKKKNQQYKH